jgi:hypothetical protein
MVRRLSVQRLMLVGVALFAATHLGAQEQQRYKNRASRIPVMPTTPGDAAAPAADIAPPARTIVPGGAPNARQGGPPEMPPPSGPTTEPAVDPNFPEEFAVLLNRSIFAKHKPMAMARPATGPSAPESTLVLRGVAVQGTIPTALIEDEAGGRTMQVHIGEDIGGGRITTINKDGLDRSMTRGGPLVHVAIGQRLDMAPGSMIDPKAGGPALAGAAPIIKVDEPGAGGAAVPLVPGLISMPDGQPTVVKAAAAARPPTTQPAEAGAAN